MVQKFWRYVYSLRQNTRTDRRTDRRIPHGGIGCTYAWHCAVRTAITKKCYSKYNEWSINAKCSSSSANTCLCFVYKGWRQGCMRTAETIQIKLHQCLDKNQLVVQICTVQIKTWRRCLCLRASSTPPLNTSRLDAVTTEAGRRFYMESLLSGRSWLRTASHWFVFVEAS